MQKSIRSFIVFFNVLYIQQLFVLAATPTTYYSQPVNIQPQVDKQPYTTTTQNTNTVEPPTVQHTHDRPQAPPEKREINFYSNKPNIGYLYNVGSKKFIGTDNKHYWLFAVDNNPLLVALVTSYGEKIGTYQEIIPVENTQNPKLGKKNSSDVHAGVKRFDVGGGSGKKRCYLFGSTSPYNRFVVTPPYYKNSSAFKIQRFGFCLGIDASMNLMQMDCVDDTTDGHGTPENDMQLFKLCRVESSNRCDEL
ncbi:hypothetical protein NEMIN01_0541 [Nematocida minor]|uniref:uncharacterized protein n=1 Tax=Nematocida minor TaxID=1912983 RepID=UPI0022210FB0|nr:uncharacterized protein NEMIN01_0541 [Nematocida minor]KAI5189478.1 hypothetical protein NEMIN01_0541 [Nematocida minor]